MRVSDAFFVLLESFEGFKSCPYLDQGGVPTIGIGTTYYPTGVRVKMTDTCIKHDVSIIYAKAIIGHTEDVISTLVRKELTQNQFDALTSFVYNVGEEAFTYSTLLRKININPNDPSIRLEFNKWVNVKKKPNSDLMKRRRKEADLYYSN